MANPEHVEILRQGAKVWNKWREENPGVMPDIRKAHLRGAMLRGANLFGTNLSSTDLGTATLSGANLFGANLSDANLRGANLSGANLSRTDLCGANLSKANLFSAHLCSANLQGVSLFDAKIGWTVFTENDLSGVNGLETVKHDAPSSIGVDTLYKSGGNIPEAFLRDCGVPDTFITYAKSLVGKAIDFYSCFISYSTKDDEFAKRLHSRMRDDNLRVWFSPEDIKGGEKLHEQIERAIQIHDRLLIVLSENSMQSEWVMTELRNARKVEVKEKRRKLFPIRLVDFGAIKEWKCFDADTGKDLAGEVREYFIPDFSNWKDHDAFEVAFARLLRDMKAETGSEPTLR